jgi:hypothetical protein
LRTDEDEDINEDFYPQMDGIGADGEMLGAVGAGVEGIL